MAKSKKIAIVVAAIALIAVIGVVGSTLAYFTDQGTKKNTFTMGKVEGTLEELGEDGQPIPIEEGLDFDNVTPNANLTKIAYMQLGNDSSDAYARVKLSWDTSKLTPEQLQEFTANPPIYTPVGNGWVKSETDDFYYYQTKLTKTDGKTSNIIENVHIPENWSNKMANAYFELNIEGYFIQADNVKVIDDAVKSGQQITTWGELPANAFEK